MVNKMKKIIAIILLILIPTQAFPNPDEFVLSKGKLIKHEGSYPWFEDNEFGHTDGVAPLATFQILYPEKYLDKTVRVLFMNDDYKNVLSSIKNDIEEIYIIKIPKDFFDSNAKIIHSIHIGNIEKLKP